MAAQLIGLYAPVMQSGKSTVANALAGHRYVTVKFAGPLKSMLTTLLMMRGASQDAAIRMVEGDLKEQPTRYLDGKSPRYALQTLGTEWGRDIMGTDFWVNCAMAQADRLMADGYNVVMDDVRFPNEAQAIKARGGLVVKITRPSIQPPENAQHASEGALADFPFDLELVNDAPTPVQWALNACHEIAVKQYPAAAVRNLEFAA